MPADLPTLQRSPMPRQRLSSTERYGILDRVTASVCFDVRRPDHLAPHLGFLSDQLAEVSRRTRKHRAAEIGEPRLHRGIGESHIDLLVECVDDLGGRVPGCAEAAPRARLKAWQELAHGWEVRQRLPARRRRHRQWTQLVGPDLLYRQRRGAEQNLHLSAKQVGHHGSAATIRHMNQVDPGHHLEKLASNMAGASDAGRSQIDLARVRLGICSELGNCFGRNGWIYHHHYGLAGDACNRRDVAEEIEVESVVKCRVDRVRRGHQEKCVAVRWSTHDRFGADISAATRAVFYDELLAESPREPWSDEPRKKVGRAARGRGGDDADRPRRIGLRPSEARYSRERGSARGQMQKISAGKFHNVTFRQLTPL